MQPQNLNVIAVKAFVPARDFELSKQFYQAIGFTLDWTNANLAGLHHGATTFFLQKFYVQNHAENFLMQLQVENVDDWHAHLETERIHERFGVRIDAPENQPWGMRDFNLFDPSGVLWRVSQLIAA